MTFVGVNKGMYVLAWTTGFATGPALAGAALTAGAGTELFAGLALACGCAALGAARLDRRLPSAANQISAGHLPAAPATMPIPATAPDGSA